MQKSLRSVCLVAIILVGGVGAGGLGERGELAGGILTSQAHAQAPSQPSMPAPIPSSGVPAAPPSTAGVQPASVPAARPGQRQATTPEGIVCSADADAQNLHGRDRTRFRRKCIAAKRRGTTTAAVQPPATAADAAPAAASAVLPSPAKP